MRVVVIIPTINELEGLQRIIPKLIKISEIKKIVIIDDGSSDGTRSLLAKFKKKFSGRIETIYRNKSKGLGDAYRAAFKYILKKNYKASHILQMDGDGAHDPRYIEKIISEVRKGNDLVIGSRYMKGAKIANFPLYRRLTSWLGNSLCRIMLGNHIYDWTTGFKMWEVGLLRKIIKSKTVSMGFAFQVETSYIAKKNNAKISEVPIEFSNCENDKSKYKFYMAVEALKFLIRTKR